MGESLSPGGKTERRDSWVTHSGEETEALGAKLLGTPPGGESPCRVIELRGELGTGKSTFARGVLRALGATGPIKSPSYTLMETYDLPGVQALHLEVLQHGLDVETLALLQLVGAVHGTDVDFVGQAQCAREAALEHLRTRRVAARLENRVEHRAGMPRPQRLQRLRQRRRVMTEVLDHFQPRGVHEQLLPALHAAEARQRRQINRR